MYYLGRVHAKSDRMRQGHFNRTRPNFLCTFRRNNLENKPFCSLQLTNLSGGFRVQVRDNHYCSDTFDRDDIIYIIL